MIIGKHSWRWTTSVYHFEHLHQYLSSQIFTLSSQRWVRPCTAYESYSNGLHDPVIISPTNQDSNPFGQTSVLLRSRIKINSTQRHDSSQGQAITHSIPFSYLLSFLRKIRLTIPLFVPSYPRPFPFHPPVYKSSLNAKHIVKSSKQPLPSRTKIQNVNRGPLFHNLPDYK
jgi:hypothetical protein